MGPLMWEPGQDWVVGMLAPEKERKAASEHLGGKELQDPRNTTTPWLTTYLRNFMVVGSSLTLQTQAPPLGSDHCSFPVQDSSLPKMRVIWGQMEKSGSFLHYNC